MANSFSSKSSNLFICKNCDYSTIRNSQYLRHLQTSKHKNANYANKLLKNANDHISFICNDCNKTFKHNSSMCRHKKKCKLKKVQKVQKVQNDNLENEDNNNNISFLSNFSKEELEYDVEKIKNMNNYELVLMLIKQNNTLLEIIKHRTM